MALPPEGKVFRVRVKRKGGTEDGLTHNGEIHVRGDIEAPKAYAVRMVDQSSGYAVAEVIEDVDPSDVITLHEWREQQQKEEVHPRQKKKDLQRLKGGQSEAAEKKSWRKPSVESDGDEESEDEDQTDDNPVGSKNDLLNGRL